MYIRETEKAVQMTMVIRYFNHVIGDDVEKKFNVWVPKSQLSTDGLPGQWISQQKVYEVVNQQVWQSNHKIYWATNSGGYVEPGVTDTERQHEVDKAQRLAQGLERHQTLVLSALAKGLKVTKRMKTSTIMRKAEEQGITL